MFCCAEMRCWRNDVCTMRKMMCRCEAMEGESSQGELFAKLQASLPLSHLALLDASSPKGRALGKTAHFAVELETNPLSLLTAFAASSPEGGAFRHLPVSRVKPPPFGGGGIA